MLPQNWFEFNSLFHELKVPLFYTLLILCDNLRTTYLTMSPISHSHTKYVEIDFSFMYDQVLQRSLDVKFVSSTTHW